MNSGLGKYTLTLSLVLFLASCSTTKPKYAETNDLYWSEMVNDSLATKTPLLSILKKENPHLYLQIEKDSKDSHLLGFWGKSLNFDSGAKKQIVADSIISDLHHKFKTDTDNKIVHAGITHTYGYLFSVLNTPYGYKRRRWVDPTLNYAFALSGNSLSPETMEGGLLSNVTYFAGTIAFKEEGAREALKTLTNVSNEVLNFDYSKLNTETVEEEITSNPSGDVLRTTLVKFPFKREEEENDYWLIYTIYTPKAHKEVLITAFPIKKDAYKKIIDQESLGPNRPVVVRYNAYLEGQMDQNLTGTKKLH
jgi:hypothetical protein